VKTPRKSYAARLAHHHRCCVQAYAAKQKRIAEASGKNTCGGIPLEHLVYAQPTP